MTFPRSQSVAYWISQLYSPPMLAFIAMGLCIAALKNEATLQDQQVWAWATLYFVFTAVLPSLYIVLLVHQGKVTDFHLRVREQRAKPTFVIILGTIVTIGALYYGSGPRLLLLLAIAQVIQTSLFFLITLHWKVSAHTASAAAVAMLGWLLFGEWSIILAILVPIVAWARVHLDRHTTAQTILGAILGSGAIAIVYLGYGGY